ncbi:cupin domain-containing protein [Candidatus Wolfebacteria bacterium]|nr:cupin domain-containing protein [Candidatus Wolfebacteria bacterium]
MKGYIGNIEKDTKENENFRKVLYTAKNSQLVLMCLLPGEEIGEEVHEEHDQFFRFEEGEGKVVINGTESAVSDGFAVVVPAGAKHNVINISGNKKLKLYTIYSPPEHKDGILHKTKADALSDNEHFDGKITE